MDQYYQNAGHFTAMLWVGLLPHTQLTQTHADGFFLLSAQQQEAMTTSEMEQHKASKQDMSTNPTSHKVTA